MIWYLKWIPFVIVYYCIYAWLSKQNNEFGGKWIWITYVYGAICPLWLIISRYSKNLLFDGMLYDNILFLSYIATMIFLGQANNFSTTQYIGLVLMIIGSICIKFTP